ncbi:MULTISPECIES: metalloregulator ArsR/SmtB family transcription factor [unclassified Imperialibacter]|uniref:ArsR/SmtB family transcription factor n=1 Tax=unclassified Imperialibacter TaxID=2629706 RepID=UPI00125621B1|nr:MULTISPECIES: metalloregulator ArsR/SmtB family transcription factor [unclassified Imperialibacter]CAD5264644.1 Transcriptional regulator [Imperialibacter sp. 89]CAD5269547.1 Transcriptional regulator [Imperialibacter sp. 75]VVT09164.1 Transcriptional regulator [Imperialibacter sp. EC-SDR9]
MSNTCIRVLADHVQIQECKDELNELEGTLKNLTRLFNLSGNAARLKILYLLKREGEMCPCDLSDILEISVGGVSQHLRKLKDGGLVVDKKVGQTVFYSLVAQSTELLLPVFDILSTSKRTVES